MNSKNNNYRSGKILFLILIMIGSVGAIFFFPLKIGDSHTCVCDKMICSNETCCQKRTNFGNENNSDMNHQVMEKMLNQHHNELLDHYLIPFGFLWWSSLIILFSGLYFLKKASRKQTA